MDSEEIALIKDCESNITIRRKKTYKSTESLDSFESGNSDYLAKSLPDLSTYNESDLKELKEEMENLKYQLLSAHNEIDNLLLENSALRKQNEEQEAVINQLKKVCTESPIRKTNLKRNKLGKENEKPKEAACEAISYTQSLEKIPQQKNISHSSHKQDKQFCMSYQTKNSTNKPNNAVCFKNNDPMRKNESNLKDMKDIESHKHRITILGSQQCTGLASKLLYFRQNLKTCYGYHITSDTKPFATAEEILKNYTNTKEKYVVMCVGENDKNPTNVITECINILKNNQNTHVIVLGVNFNKYLNEYMLNSMFKLYCNNSKNCTFIDKPSYYLSKEQYLKYICKRIHLVIENQDYASKYLSYNKRKINLRDLPSKHVASPKIGTIPYYFPIISVSRNENIAERVTFKNRQSKEKQVIQFFRSKTKCDI